MSFMPPSVDVAVTLRVREGGAKHKAETLQKMANLRLHNCKHANGPARFTFRTSIGIGPLDGAPPRGHAGPHGIDD